MLQQLFNKYFRWDFDIETNVTDSVKRPYTSLNCPRPHLQLDFIQDLIVSVFCLAHHSRRSHLSYDYDYLKYTSKEGCIFHVANRQEYLLGTNVQIKKIEHLSIVMIIKSTFHNTVCYMTASAKYLQISIKGLSKLYEINNMLYLFAEGEVIKCNILLLYNC